MKKERLYIYDTTLRDGAQTAGIDFSIEDKLSIVSLLEQLGVDYIEGGYPGANPVDSEFFSKKRTKNAVFTAFGMTKRAGRSIENDSGLQALLQSKSDAICFVAKAWDHQVKLALGISLDENLNSIEQSIKAAINDNKEVMLDCEHFFDGYKADSLYAKSCVKVALDAGARWVILCDTNGGTLPAEIEIIINDILTICPKEKLGIHAHNDTGNAVANSLAAVRAGVRQIQGTLNGIGERCGNADLISLIPTLMLKEDFSSKFELAISDRQLKNLTHISRAFDDLLNRAPNPQSPYVGSSAFVTKAGIHASALMKDVSCYEHIAPELVGNERSIKMSQQAGKSNLLVALKRHNIKVDKNDLRLDSLLNEVKEREARGYTYDSADASFALLAHKHLGTLPTYFEVEGYRTSVERRYNARGELVTVSEAVVKISIDGQLFMSVAEGNGPVNALDLAMRKDLGKYTDFISDLELVDYKVRILDGGTGAVTRVLIESRDGAGTRWMTIGVSPNIIDASFEALYEAINYKLLRNVPRQSAYE